MQNRVTPRGEGNENSQKKSVGLISKKHFARAAQFFSNKQKNNFTFLFCTFPCRRFARLQRETSRNFLVTRFMEEMLYVVLFTFFSLPFIFSLVAASISPFSHSCYKSVMFFFQRNWSPLVFIFRSSSLSVIHVNVDIEI